MFQLKDCSTLTKSVSQKRMSSVNRVKVGLVKTAIKLHRDYVQIGSVILDEFSLSICTRQNLAVQLTFEQLIENHKTGKVKNVATTKT